MKSKNKSISFVSLYAGVLLVLVVITFTGCIFFAGSDTGIAVPNLTVKGAPSDITALSLRITGPGMAPVESYYSSVPSSITIEVPAGKDRQFELIAHVDPSSLSAAVSFKGTATVDLAAGETTNITLNMIVNETKLVIPDYNNNRIVQIDEISGNSWLELIGSNIANIGWTDFDFKPYDVAFDSQGRIYIANNIGVSGMGRNCVVRVDDISGSGGLVFSQPEYDYGIVAVAVDGQNEYVYYATSNAIGPSILFRSNLDGTGEAPLALTGVETMGTIYGMAVDEKGTLYIAGKNSTVVDRVFQYDTNIQAVTAVNINASLSNPWDVLIKEDYLYIANLLGGNGFRILKLDHDLGSDQWFGDIAPPENPGSFYGPRRFIAIVNKKIYILDDADGPESILAMDNIGGWDNWDVFRAEDIAETPFIFYGSC